MPKYEITTERVPIDFETDDETMRLIQRAKNLLMCRKGEIPYDRQRGLDPAIFDLPLQEMQEVLLPELDRVMLWEPDVEVVSATAEMTRDNEIVIRCVIETAA